MPMVVSHTADDKSETVRAGPKPAGSSAQPSSKTDGDFASYCRMVDARHLSNGKQKADNNQKCGNKYLSWLFVEGANFSRRYDEQCRQWFDRKASPVIATKAP